MDKQFLSAKDIAAMIGVEPRSVCRWAQFHIDDFPQPSINQPKCKRWRASLVMDWIKSQERRSNRA